MERIKNVSDQLEPYASEVAGIIKEIQKKYDLEFNQAAAAVGIAALDMLADVMHDMEGSISQIPDRTGYISDSLEATAPSA